MEILSRDDLVTILLDLNPQPAHFLNMQSDGSVVHAFNSQKASKKWLSTYNIIEVVKKGGKKIKRKRQRDQNRER
jgi:hypothetical protein